MRALCSVVKPNPSLPGKADLIARNGAAAGIKRDQLPEIYWNWICAITSFGSAWFQLSARSSKASRNAFVAPGESGPVV